MKKVLFLTFHGFDPSNGISKKISYQVNALRTCGMEVHLCYMDEASSKRRLVDDIVIADYGKGILSKIRKRIEFDSITRWSIDNHIEMVYIRSNNNASLFTIRMVKRMKQAGMKVVMEIPTYPYDQEYVSQGIARQIFQDKIFRKQLAKQLDAIVTFSDYETIFGQKTIRISNGIDFSSIPVKKNLNNTSHELHLIGVAEIHQWHGFDRIVKGLSEYYEQPHDMKVIFHMVGYFYSAEIEAEYKKMLSDTNMEQYVILHGKQHGEALDQLFEQCDFGIGSLGRHRVGIQKIKTLKNREYAARGIPFVYSETDTDFENMPYVLKVPADETPVKIIDIIRFYQSLSITPQDIRNSIKDLSWEHQMHKVLKDGSLTSKERFFDIERTAF